jgi:hypothetical protein
MRKLEENVSWVVYKIGTQEKTAGLNAVCEQSEWDEMEQARPGVVGGDAVGQRQEGAQERLVMGGPVGDLHEVVAVGQDATEAAEEHIDEAVLEVTALASGVGDGLQLLHQGTGHRCH